MILLDSKEVLMREPLAMFYFMLPVLVPATIVLWWAAMICVFDQLKEIGK